MRMLQTFVLTKRDHPDVELDAPEEPGEEPSLTIRLSDDVAIMGVRSVVLAWADELQARAHLAAGSG